MKIYSLRYWNEEDTLIDDPIIAVTDEELSIELYNLLTEEMEYPHAFYTEEIELGIIDVNFSSWADKNDDNFEPEYCRAKISNIISKYIKENKNEMGK